jgi:hypothetical protein
MTPEPTPEQIAVWGRASRAASGVPAKIEDRSVLARLITLAFAGTDRDGGGPPVRPAAASSRARAAKKGSPK